MMIKVDLIFEKPNVQTLSDCQDWHNVLLRIILVHQHINEKYPRASNTEGQDEQTFWQDPDVTFKKGTTFRES